MNFISSHCQGLEDIQSLCFKRGEKRQNDMCLKIWEHIHLTLEGFVILPLVPIILVGLYKSRPAPSEPISETFSSLCVCLDWSNKPIHDTCMLCLHLLHHQDVCTTTGSIKAFYSVFLLNVYFELNIIFTSQLISFVLRVLICLLSANYAHIFVIKKVSHLLIFTFPLICLWYLYKLKW